MFIAHCFTITNNIFTVAPKKETPCSEDLEHFFSQPDWGKGSTRP